MTKPQDEDDLLLRKAIDKNLLGRGFFLESDKTSKDQDEETICEQSIGKFRIIKLLGKGGLGEVYLAYDTVLQRNVALKILTKIGEQELARFRREAILTAKLNHPNIVRIYEIAEHGNTHYISMQYIDGEPLDEKDLTMREKVEVIRQVALALDHAHGLGIFHRDVKPANILIDREGRSYLTDFGIAKQISLQGARSNISVSGMVVGTPNYMSPEQAKGEIDKVDHLSDVYSLGATLYYLLTQREPYHADSAIEIINKVMQGEFAEPRKINKKIPAELEAIILKAMEKEREKRYQSTFELARDLKNYLEGKPVLAKPRSVVSKMIRRLKRKKITLGIVLAFLIILTAVSFAAYLKTKESQRHTFEISEKLKDCEKKLSEFNSYLYMPASDITNKYDLLNEVVKTSDELLKSNDVEVRAWAYFYIGSVLFHKGRLKDAYENLSKAISLWGQPIFFFTRAKIALEIYQEKLWLSCAGNIEEAVEQHKSWRENAIRDIEKYLQSTRDGQNWLTTYSHAMIAYCEKKPDARDLIKNLLGNVPMEQSADIWKLYAEINVRLRNFDEALEAYRQALEIKRCDYKLYIGLGGAYLYKAHLLAVNYRGTSVDFFNSSINEFSRVLFINPLSDVAYVRRAYARHGLLEFTQEGLDEAIDDCTKAIDINPESALALSLRSILYSIKLLRLFNQGQDVSGLEKALKKDIDDALRIEPDNELVLENCAGALVIKADFLFQQGKDPGSECEKAVQICEQILSRHKNCQKITGVFSRCLMIMDIMATALNRKANYLVNQKMDPTSEVEKSVEVLSKAIKMNPVCLDSYINIALSYQNEARYLSNRGINPAETLGKSEQYLKKALEINPDFDMTYFHLGMVYFLKLDYSYKIREIDNLAARHAIENFTKAIDLTSSQRAFGAISKLVFLYEYRGHCYFMIRDKKSAISDWQRATEIAPHLKGKFLQLIQLASQQD